MVVSSLALTRLPTVKGELGISGTGSDAVLERLIDAVSQAMSQEAGRKFHYEAGIVERVPGFGSYRLQVSRAPLRFITSIESLNIDGTVDTTFLATDYEIEDSELGYIYQEIGWPSTARNVAGFSGKPLPGTERARIRITYTGGWITREQDDVGALGTRDLPFDLEEGCIWSVVSLYKRRKDDLDKLSEANEDISIAYRGRRGLLLRETVDIARSYGNLLDL